MISVFSTSSLNSRGRYCGFAGLSVAVGMISPVLEAATVSLPGSTTTPTVISTVTTTSVLPSAPNGSDAPVSPAMAMGGAGESILDGFSFSAITGATYDTNVTRAPGDALNPKESDFFLKVGAGISYQSKAQEWTFGGSYAGSYDNYFDNSDYSGMNHDADASVKYEGGRLTSTLKTEFDVTQGGNRNYSSAFVELTNSNTVLTARYRVSPKTTLTGNIGQRYTSATGGNFGDTEAFDMGTSALWKYSPLTEFGPGLRYTYRTGSSQTGRSSVGPTLTANYKLSTKVTMESRVGVDFAKYDEGGSADPTVAAAIGLDYKASKLWGMKFSLYRDNQADAAVAGAFTEVTAIRLGYLRNIRRATLNLGVAYETSAFDTATTTGTRPDRDYYSLDSSIGMPVLSGTCLATFFMRYSDQTGSSIDTWDDFQAGISLSRKF